VPADASPGQLSDAVATAGEETARAKINAAMEQARAEITGFVEVEKSANELLAKSVTQTNETIRAESETRAKLLLAGIKEHWFFSAWRPAFGWCFVAVWAAFGGMLTVVTARAAWLSPDALTTLKDAWPLFASYFGPGALVLGVLIPSRSYEKGEAMKSGTPMPNAKPTPPPPAVPVKPSAPVKPPAKPGMPPPVLGRD
jgi:hypothetical protein